MTGSRPKGPGFVYGSVSIVLLVVVGVLTLSATQPPPPTIAEFAPQAVEQITDAPSEQTSRFGRGAGGECPPGFPDCGLDASDDLTGPGLSKPPPPIDVPRVRQCIGDPPRQIEDPQSPPCVPYWDGDNGGETSKGVTANSIRIGIWGSEIARELIPAFFNRRFEFYGRKLEVHQAGGGNNCQQKRNAAVHVAEEIKAFAATDPASGGVTCYYDELADRGVVSATVDPHLNEAYMASKHPYIWSYPMGTEEMFRNIGRWACQRLGNQKARFSPDPLIRAEDRKFGIILQSTTQATGFDLDPIYEELARCGQRDVPTAQINHDHGSSDYQNEGATNPTMASNAILEMKTNEVTSVICLCVIFMQQYIPGAANGQQYFPEWLMSTFFFNDSSIWIKSFWPSAEQRQSIMGLSFRPRQVTYDNTPVIWAMREIQPGYQPTVFELQDAYLLYRSLMIIASGIQMAGPNLTPQTFARGLQSTRFPNPDHPIKAGRVGFAGNHSMTIDAAEFWWSESARSPYHDEGRGSLCYVEGGRRFRLPDWPRGDAGLFEPPCDSD